MKPADDIKKFVKDAAAGTRPEMDAKVLTAMLAAYENNQKFSAEADKADAGFWRQVMKSKLTKLAAAAAVLIVIGLVVYSQQGRIDIVTPAYALEQTIEANKNVRTIHMQFQPIAFGSISELWAEFDEQGELLVIRYNFSDTEDGPKDVIWENAKAQVWFKKKNGIATLTEKNILDKLRLPSLFFDPKLIIEDVYKRQAAGELQVEILDKTEQGDPITLTVSKKDQPQYEVYKIDPKTKLVQEIEKYQRQENGEDKFLGSRIYLDYNQPIDQSFFEFNPPGDVMRIDFTKQQIGIVRGDLSEEEICLKVVREFFESMMAGDFDKAGQIYSGIPGERLRQAFGAVKILRIISVDNFRPHANPATGGFQVSCKLEIEENGQKSIKEFKGIGVREAVDVKQPGRWSIFGGI
jgi:hypothetical protein